MEERKVCTDGLAQVQECMVTDELFGKIKDAGLVYHS